MNVLQVSSGVFASVKTAFVPRPLEYGPGGRVDSGDGKPFDVEARDFLELATKL